MRRRQFVLLVGGVSLARPFVTFAQSTAMRFIGYLSSGSPNERAHLVEAFRQGLRKGGYVDGKDVAIEYRWAEGHYDRLPRLASELVSRKVAVIYATGGLTSGLAAKSATSTIPIVFTGGLDPVKAGLVASLGRPGANLTGIVNFSGSLNAKRVQILRDLVPSAANIAYLVNPTDPEAETLVNDVQASGGATGTKVTVLNATTESEIDVAFTALKQSHVHALVVSSGSLFLTRRDQIVGLAARDSIPTCYPFREYAEAGGLVAYGPDNADTHRQGGAYTALILKGARPADLPVIQATKFELVLNLKTAKKLGLNVSRDFLSRVDEVIE